MIENLVQKLMKMSADAQVAGKTSKEEATPVAVVCERIVIKPKTEILPGATGLDGKWEEEKHHRADNGRFTSGGGRGKVKGREEKEEEKKDGTGEKHDKKDRPFDPIKMRYVISDAFRQTGGGLKEIKNVHRHYEVKIDVKWPGAAFGKCHALNKVLGRHHMKARIENPRKWNELRIGMDEYDDAQIVDDPMLEVLVDLCRIELLAKDLHYRAFGKPFYGIHQLADLVGEISKDSDALNEVYYMGEKGENPPKRADVASKAAQIVSGRGTEAALQGDELINSLCAACTETAAAVERAKKPGVSSGTAAVLDGISQKALQAKGLLARTLADGNGQSAAADAGPTSGDFSNPVKNNAAVQKACSDALTVKNDLCGRPSLVTK